ncbi:MAG: hypothetical protein IPG43_23950 [Proteobacteria bacterium]|nr:hypothetical protein [Pseudomonadota bacterium]
MHPRIPRAIVASVTPAPLSARAVRREFDALRTAGVALAVSGAARHTPDVLLDRGHGPRHLLELFDTRYFLSAPRQNPDLRFFVAYVMPPAASRRRARLYARIFYKDVSLIWRSASHVVRSEHENWVGKGDVTVSVEDGYETVASAEETTDLPLEVQTALEDLNRQYPRVKTDHAAVEMVLRNGPDSRIRPYRDFSAPRARAASNPRNRINGGKPIAWFTHKGRPHTLRFAPGFAPDFAGGVLETSALASSLYGGCLERFRIVSHNREVQYMFFASPRQVWIIPPQATTTEIMSYGVRTVGVLADDDLCVPGYEYHYLDESVSPPEMVSQIPAGYVGAANPVDPCRADASRWLDALPVIKEFRRVVLNPM